MQKIEGVNFLYVSVTVVDNCVGLYSWMAGGYHSNSRKEKKRLTEGVYFLCKKTFFSVRSLFF